MKSLLVKIVSKRQEAEGIAVLELSRPDGSSLPAFSAGSHIDVQIKPGVVRQYSLCNHPEERHRYVIGVLRDPASRGGSVAIHDELKEGRLIEISEPRNHFELVHAKRHLLFAGGIGVTPLLCMAERLAQIDGDFEMHYCSRTISSTAFRERIASSPFSGRVHIHYDDGAAEQRLDLPSMLAVPRVDTHIYVCGPAGFIDFVCQAAKSNGWPAENVHVEYFAAQSANSTSNEAFEVKIASTGAVITIPADKSVTAALREHGIDIYVSCEQGVCGTCITRVLEGTPEHRDQFLTDEEKAKNDQFTPCCSRSKGKLLVLDL